MKFVLRGAAARLGGRLRKDKLMAPSEGVESVQENVLPIITGIAGIAIPAIKDLAPLFGSGNTKREAAAHLRLEEARFNSKMSLYFQLLEAPDVAPETVKLIHSLMKDDIAHTLRVKDMVADMLQGKDDDA